jgi:hypothetical protein
MLLPGEAQAALRTKSAHYWRCPEGLLKLLGSDRNRSSHQGMSPLRPFPCPDCDSSVTRRDFIKSTIGGAAAITTGGLLMPFTGVAETAAALPKSETLVGTLFKSLTEQQRTAICFPFDDPLRSEVDNNWNITKPTVGGFFNKDQQQMIREIFLGLHSPEYADKVMKQVVHDSGKDGFEGGSSIAIFGEPGTGKFEFVLTGRHCTRRCDGDSVEGAAFGGPIFYGHAAEGFNEKPDHPGNAYWFQARRANEVFQMFDGAQREKALLGTSRGEDGKDTVKLTGRRTGLPGIPMAELSGDQREHVRKVLADLLAPFRKEDADESMRLVDAAGFEHLHMAFYKNENIGSDEVWDVWQIEGPSMIWYFRGKPHVHCWANINSTASV